MAEPMDYASAGVDIDLEGSAVASLIASLGGSTRKPGTPGAPVHLPGGFGGLIEFGDSLLALATDGVGSKLQIASALNQWGGVGIDCMAMNVNDLLCVGAEPIAFVDYVAVPKPDPATHAALGASLAEACRLARVTLAGGETASLPGIVTELDLSGTALGYVKKGDTITGEHLRAGDVLIGLPSSGVHSNGYSLVRKVMAHVGAEYTDNAPLPLLALAGLCFGSMAWTTNQSPSVNCSSTQPGYTVILLSICSMLALPKKWRSQSVICMASATSLAVGCPTCCAFMTASAGTLMPPLRLIPNSNGCSPLAALKRGRCTAPSTCAVA